MTTCNHRYSEWSYDEDSRHRVCLECGDVDAEGLEMDDVEFARYEETSLLRIALITNHYGFAIDTKPFTHTVTFHLKYDDIPPIVRCETQYIIDNINTTTWGYYDDTSQ